MTEVPLTTGPPECVLPPLDSIVQAELDKAVSEGVESVRTFVERHPRILDGWAHLGEAATVNIEAYAYFRVGYHRGLDALRANGWRGNGYVRAANPSNLAFLRCLSGLGTQADVIGESDEADRCAQFLRQLDPTWADGILDAGA